MKKTLYPFLLVLLVAACQPPAKPVTVVAAGPPTVVPEPVQAQVVDSVQTVELPANFGGPIMTEAGPPVTDIPAFLAANNLAELWQANTGQDENSDARPTLLEGFYGAEHRHIAFIFDHVRQDSMQPSLFRVQGRSRFRKTITPFAGTFTVSRVKPLRAFLDLDSVAATQARAYSVTAHFVLREDSTTHNAGTFEGTATTDVFRLATGSTQLLQSVNVPDKDLPARGAGQLFRGQWQSQRTGRKNPVAFAIYSQAVVPDAMADLFLGDRGEAINPKYARLGWSEGWENTEWWAKSPKPTIHL